LTKKSTTNSRAYTQPPFLRLGGTPILDFCNTLVCHGDLVDDRLRSSADAQRFLAEFFQSTGTLSEKDYKEVIKFRAHLRSFFGSRLAGDFDANKEHEFQEWLLSHPFVLSIQPKEAAAKLVALEKKDHHLENLILEFLNFSRDYKLSRLKKCANPRCSHFFYDTSKANSRSWCSMKSCGNIMKARAFYDRHKSKRPESSK